MASAPLASEASATTDPRQFADRPWIVIIIIAGEEGSGRKSVWGKKGAEEGGEGRGGGREDGYEGGQVKMRGDRTRGIGEKVIGKRMI